MNATHDPEFSTDYRTLKKDVIPCVCCGSNDFYPAFTGDRHGFGIETVVCKKCGLIFTNPRPSAQWFESFYSLHYRKFYEAVETPDEAYLKRDWVTGRHGRNAEFLKTYIPPSGRLLDIGCAEGTFLHEFEKRYKTWSVEGLEPSIGFSEFARKHYGLKQVRTGFMTELESCARGQYDLVTLNHVLEHVLDPASLLKAIRTLLKPDGLLFIDVPDAIGGEPGLGRVHIAHVYQFSTQSLSTLLRKAGFSPLVTEPGKEEPSAWTFHVVAKLAADDSIAIPPVEVDYRAIAKEFKSQCTTPFVVRLRRGARRLLGLSSPAPKSVAGETLLP